MEKKLYREMIENINKLDDEYQLSGRKLFLFGHCNATLELIDLLESKGIRAAAILDNSKEKQGLKYRGAVVIYPHQIEEFAGDDPEKDSIVLITSRFYASMQQQLRELGYNGQIRKVIDYNSYAEYSLSDETIARMSARERHGNELMKALSAKYPGEFKVFCPFNALGDIYFMISYWEAFAEARHIGEAVFCVTSRVLTDVIRMFGDYQVEVYEQKELDAMVQSAIYTQDENCFIAHQDRPYIIKLHNALRHKCIPLEQIYCCGVYGLKSDTEPVIPYGWKEWADLETIKKDRSVILSPYAKSVTAIRDEIWSEITDHYNNMGYEIYTNVCGDEKPLPGTRPLSAKLNEMKSIVERAGTFIGIRSGLCDIIRTADCRKIALYPDYNYSDTKWKAIDMYTIDGFENILVEDGDIWEKIIRK